MRTLNGSEPAEILYKIFNGIIAKRIERCYPLIEHAIHRIYSKRKQRSQKDRLCGFYHLASVSEAKFLWADRVESIWIGSTSTAFPRKRESYSTCTRKP